MYAAPPIVSIKDSAHGPVLVTLANRGGTVIAARAGDAPLAWKRSTGHANNQRRPWTPCRPELDIFLTTHSQLDFQFSIEKSWLWKKSHESTCEPNRGEPWRAHTIDGMPAMAMDRRSEVRIVRKWAKVNGRDHVELVGKRRLTAEGRRVREQLAARHPLMVRQALTSRESLRREIRGVLRIHPWMDKLKLWLDAFDPACLDFLDRNKFRHRRWHLVSTWMRVPGLRGLMDDNPGLAWLLASSWCLRATPVTQPMRSLRALARKPRKEILRWLGLEGGDATLHLLSRLNCSQLNDESFSLIRRATSDPGMRHRLLNLSGPVAIQTVEILVKRKPVSFQLLAEMNREWHECRRERDRKIGKAYIDTLRMARQIGDDSAPRRLAGLRTERSLIALHDELVDDTIRHPVNRADWVNPIQPPLHPTTWMKPMAHCNELIAEGREMRHCVATYAEEILRGRYFVYAIHHPAGRATLGIERDSGGNWEIDQIKGLGNHAAHPSVRSDVKAWFHQALAPCMWPDDPF